MTGNSIERLNQTDLIRVSILEKALRLELLGMKGRRSAYAIIKREFGMKGNRQTVHAELKSYLDSRKEFELGDAQRYRKGHADGVQEVRDYMTKQVGHCNFGE